MRIIQEQKKLHYEINGILKKKESVQHVSNIQYIYFLNKHIKCNVWRLAVRYDIYVIRRLKVKSNSHTSKYAKHILEQSLTFGPIHQTMQILQYQDKGTHRNTIGWFFIYAELSKNNHLNDEHPKFPNLNDEHPTFPNLNDEHPIFPNLNDEHTIFPNLNDEHPIFRKSK
jgi:hypothetical protein